MTDKINQLARAAKLSWGEDAGCGFPEIKYPAGYEEFAKSIIHACLHQIADIRAEHTLGSLPDEVLTEAMHAIQNHFAIPIKERTLRG